LFNENLSCIKNDKHKNKYRRLFFPKLKQNKTPWERGKWAGGMSGRGVGTHGEK
jgi:hypothetical protein